MEAHKRVIGRSKQIGADCKVLFYDQPIPFHGCECYEYCSQSNSREPPEPERSRIAPETTLGEHNCETARKQADCRYDWHREHICRIRTRQALAEIKNIGNHKDRKERRFS